MTNKEAIETLRANYPDDCYEQLREAVDIAINALTAQPSSSCAHENDSISRRAAIDALTEYGNGRAIFISVGEAVIRIEQLPPSQPEQLSTNLAEVSTDLISRQAAIDALDIAPFDDYGDYMRARELIEQFPSAQPEQRWIPVTEQLPDTDNEVLVTVLDMEDDYVEVYKGFYQDHEWWTQWCHGCLRIKDEPCGANIVTAWMPLPKPYRKEGGE